MTVVSWLAVLFTAIHYVDGHGPVWGRPLVLGVAGLVVLILALGPLISVLDGWQTSREPAESSLLAMALFVAFVFALALVCAAMMD